jgi:hypothetical protein
MGIMKAILIALFTIAAHAQIAPVKVSKPKPKSKPAVERKWPDTDPPIYYEGELLLDQVSIDGEPYHKVEVSPGKWQWQVDRESIKRCQEDQHRKSELFWALRSRVLTESEMKDVEDQGDRLNTPMACSGMTISYPGDNERRKRELNDALLAQFRLRRAADCKCSCEGK